ncbi:thiol-disulfide oxidoreductase ResA [Paenibacillaceae bacterium]|nr:thiol-disulfide oxidoreductase ResA [Paenibacillaceae bacterium]
MERAARNGWVKWLVLVIVLVAIVYAVMQTVNDKEVKAEIGKRAPDFTLTNLQGEQVQLKDLRGKGVLLNFWASWCGPCVKEMPLLNDAYTQVPGVEIIAINMGEKPDKARQFAESLHLKFPVLLDEQSDVSGQYRVSGLPVTYLVDPSGTVIEKYVGELQGYDFIMDLMKKVQPADS